MESFKSKQQLSCTLCYKTINRSNGFNCNDITSKSFKFITLISRQLSKQSYRNALKPTLFSKLHRCSYKSLHKFTKSDDSFNFFQVCEDCEVTTQRFCNFYQKIQELEMRMDFEITKIWETMHSADKVSLIVEQINDHFSVLESCDSSKLIEFRKTLKNNIQIYQSNRKATSAPRVHLLPVILNDSPSKIEHIQNFIPRAFSPINLDEPMIIFDENDKTPREAHQDTQNELDKIAYPLSTVTDTSATTSTEKHRKASSNFKKYSGKFRCISCPQRFSTKFAHDQHNIFQHIEIYFPTAKVSSLTNKQFRAYLDHTIEKTIDDFPKVESKYKCPYCYVPKLLEKRSAKFHLIQHHRLVINDKLIELQRSNVKINDLLPIKLSTTNRHVCPVCSKRFQDNRAVKRHEATVHPEIFIKSSKLANEDDETFRTYVGYVVEQQVKEQFLKLKVGQKLSVHKTKLKHKCKICSNTLLSRTEAKTHLILEDDGIIVEKLNETRNSGKSFDEIKLELELARCKHGGGAKYYPSVVTRKIQDATAGQQTECTICHKNPGSSYNLSRHGALYHPEQFFVSIKSELVAATQFSLFVKHLYSQELGKFDKIKGSVSKKIKYRCNHCPKILKSLVSVRVHVLLVHFDKLAEKLKELQCDFLVKDSIK